MCDVKVSPERESLLLSLLKIFMQVRREENTLEYLTNCYIVGI